MKWPEDFINKVISGDCIDVMRQIPTDAVDAIITDPPYGIGLEYDTYDDSQQNLIDSIPAFMDEALRVAKNTVFTCGVQNQWLYPQPRWVMCWSYAPSTNKRGFWGFNQWQPILCYGQDPYLTNGLGARGDLIQDMRPPEHNHNHPCPKPLTFMRKLISRVSIKPNQIILDPFAGSGTTLVAAKQLGRRYIGIDVSQLYCEIAQDRLRQGELFNQAVPE